MDVQEVLIPVLWHQGPSELVDLQIGLRICPLTDELRSKWLKGGRDFQTHRGLHMATHAIHGEVGRTPTKVLLNHESEWLEHFFTGLRLLVEGEPGLGHTYMRLRMSDGRDDTSGHSSHPMWALPFKQASGIVDEAIVRKAESFVSAIRDRRHSNQNLALALRRFNYSYARNLAADSLLDLTVSLETLFAADGPGEIGYKVAARSARLISAPPSEQHIVTAKALYRVRSEIVHGGHYERIHESKSLRKLANVTNGESLSGHDLVERAVETARNLARVALKAYLEHPASADPHDMIRRLDLT